MDLTALLAWVALIFYALSLIPQMIKNASLKTTQGLSSLSLIAYFFGYGTNLTYIYALSLILPYKIIVPIEFFFMLIIISQKFYYEGLLRDKAFFYSILITSIIIVLCIIFAFHYTFFIGSLCGWISLFCFIAHPIPQVIKNYRRKSVEGFSFGFVTLLAIAVTCELIVAIIKKLPPQTFGCSLKGLFFYIIFCYQFWLYKGKEKSFSKLEIKN
jgi:uncharacterized protein with PQ loop repeat